MNTAHNREEPSSETQQETESVMDADAVAAALQKALAGEENNTPDMPDALESMKADYEAKLAEVKDQLLRAVAETENVRRRASRDVEETGKYAVSGFARDMISVAENLFRTLQNIPEETRAENELLKSLADGVDMTLRELLNAFDKHGIKRVDPQGEKFDHNLHQAVSQVEDPSKESGTVLHVMQAGYTLHDRLLRPAMVVVSKRGSETEQKVDTQV